MSENRACITIRCPEYVLKLLDTVCNMYGFTRAEVCRMGAITFCQSLLATDTLKSVCDMAYKLNSELKDGQAVFTTEQRAQIEQLNQMAQSLTKSLGLE